MGIKEILMSPTTLAVLGGGLLGTGVGLTLEYVVIKPMSKGNQDWVTPVTYALVGMGATYYGMM